MKIFNWELGKTPERKKNNREEFSHDVIKTNNPEYVYDLFTKEFSGIESDSLLEYIEAARKGFPYFFYRYCDTILQRDARVKTTNRRLKVSVLKEQFKVKCENEKMQKYADEMISHLGMKLKRFFADCVEANTKGIKQFEINWYYVNGMILPKEIRPIPNELYIYNEKTLEYSILDINSFTAIDIRNFMQANPDRYDIGMLTKVNIHPMKLLQVFSIDGDQENAFMDGIYIALCLLYYLKSYHTKDMSVFIEEFASPTKIGKYDSVNPRQKEEMLKAFKVAKAMGYLVMPKSSDISLLNDGAKGTGADIFLKTIKHWNSEITLVTLGEEETTQMGNKGSLAALEIKERVSDDFAFANLTVISDALETLIKRGYEMSYGLTDDKPSVEFIKVKTLSDKKTQSEVNRNLADIGYRPTKENIVDQMGVEVEEYKRPANNVPPSSTGGAGKDDFEKELREYLMEDADNG